MGRDTLRRILDFFNIWKGQFYDAEYDMWFIAETHPLSPTYIERGRNEKVMGEN